MNPKETIFEHLGDAYGWEVPFSHTKRIPLPVIVFDKGGSLHCFLSSRVTGGETYQDGDATFMIPHEGDYKGKLVQVVDGGEYRPWDFSITKNVLGILIAAALVIMMTMSPRNWYKKQGMKGPRGTKGMLELVIDFVYTDTIKPILGKESPKYGPYLLTAFFFILITNMLGLLPIFPGGANVTGNINITFFLALCTMLAINLFGNKEYWKEIFWPDVPAFLKAYPVAIMPIIELFGIITKPFALMVRLFANMMAGHAIILSFTAIIFIGWSLNAFLGSGLTLLSFVMMLFMNCLEFLVAFIQAYVFTMLSAVFIGLAHPEHEGH